MEITKILNKKPSKRALDEINKLYEIMIEYDLLKNLKGKFKDEKQLLRIFSSISQNMEIKFHKKGEIIYLKDLQLQTQLYIVLQGSVTFVWTKIYSEKMTLIEYIKYIDELYKFNESDNDDILKTIIENKIFYPINESHLPNLKNIILFLVIYHYLFTENNITMLKEIFLNCDRKMIEFNFNSFNEEIFINPKPNYHEDHVLNENLKIKFNHLKNDNTILHFSHCLKNFNKKNTVKLYKKQTTLKFAREHLGNDYINNNHSVQISMYSAENNVIMGLINDDILKNSLLSEKIRMNHEEGIFLSNQTIFINIPYDKFKSRFINFFIKEIFNYEDSLFNENDYVDFIYFIYKGDVELSIYKNLHEMKESIDEVLKLKRVSEGLKIKLGIYLNKKDTFLFTDFEDKRNKIKENDSLGLEEYFFGIKRLYRANVKSRFLEVLKIKTKHFTEIIDYNIALREELEKIILIKMKALVLRFKDMYDYHYQYIMKKDKDLSIINKEIINDSFPNDVQFKLNYNKCIIKNDKHHIPIKLLKKKDFLKSKKKIINEYNINKTHENGLKDNQLNISSAQTIKYNNVSNFSNRSLKFNMSNSIKIKENDESLNNLNQIGNHPNKNIFRINDSSNINTVFKKTRNIQLIKPNYWIMNSSIVTNFHSTNNKIFNFKTENDKVKDQNKIKISNFNISQHKIKKNYIPRTKDILKSKDKEKFDQFLVTDYKKLLIEKLETPINHKNFRDNQFNSRLRQIFSNKIK